MAEQCAKGKQVILFGQDEKLCRAMANTYGALWAPDMIPGELTNKAERAFFDVGLMSRCRKIVSGSSDFTELAAAIQSKLPTSLKRRWSHSKTIAILTTPADPGVDAAASDLQIAFSYGAAARLIIRNDLKDWMRAIEYLDEASKLDPDNSFYTFVKAAVLYSRKQTARADTLIASIQAVTVQDGLVFLLTNTNAPVQRYMPLLHAAGDGSQWASLCLAFDRSASTAKRAQHASKALHLPSLNPKLRELLEDIRQSRTTS
jgi:hypothetical protein